MGNVSKGRQTVLSKKSLHIQALVSFTNDFPSVGIQGYIIRHYYVEPGNGSSQ